LPHAQPLTAQELTPDGIPRFPTFVGVRIDATVPHDAVVRAAVREAD
jgi:hypothetical protein